MNACQQMERVDGLDEYLKKCKLHGEKKIVISLYLKKQYLLLNTYFRIRNAIRNIKYEMFSKSKA